MEEKEDTEEQQVKEQTKTVFFDSPQPIRKGSILKKSSMDLTKTNVNFTDPQKNTQKITPPNPDFLKLD